VVGEKTCTYAAPAVSNSAGRQSCRSPMPEKKQKMKPVGWKQVGRWARSRLSVLKGGSMDGCSCCAGWTGVNCVVVCGRDAEMRRFSPACLIFRVLS
jgi:hypothetical protein